MKHISRLWYKFLYETKEDITWALYINTGKIKYKEWGIHWGNKAKSL